MSLELDLKEKNQVKDLIDYKEEKKDDRLIYSFGLFDIDGKEEKQIKEEFDNEGNLVSIAKTEKADGFEKIKKEIFDRKNNEYIKRIYKNLSIPCMNYFINDMEEYIFNLNTAKVIKGKSYNSNKEQGVSFRDKPEDVSKEELESIKNIINTKFEKRFLLVPKVI